MAWFIYGMIAAGYSQVTDTFCDAIIWPYHLGKAIGRAALASDGKRGEL